jgi:glycosyltransferase involved in cell wall biosynthesis
LKVLLVAPMPPQAQAPGAIPMVLHAQLSALSVQHQVTIVTLAGPDPAEHAAVSVLRVAGFEVLAACRREPHGWPRLQRAARWITAWLRGRDPWRTIWFQDAGLQKILDQVLAERSFDVIQVEDNAMGAYRYRTRAPIVFTEHEVRRPRPVDWRGWQSAGFAQWAWREADWRRWPMYQRRIWPRFDRIQAFTARDAEAIRTLSPQLADRVRVNPFGIDLPAQVNNRHEDDHTLLFVGNFTHAPNVDAALWLGATIMPLLRQRCPGVRLTLVGPYPPRSVQALACEDVVVTGRVPQLEPYLEPAAVVIAPIRIGGGMRMKVLHSMAQGKAVVTTARGAEGLALNGHALPLIVAEDVESIVTTTAALLHSREQRQRLGQQARAFVAAHYSPRAYVQRLQAVYAEVVKEQP